MTRVHFVTSNKQIAFAANWLPQGFDGLYLLNPFAPRNAGGAASSFPRVLSLF